MTKNRLEAFSDGVIAIIITIMVLEIKVPHGHDWASLKPLIPVMLSYLLSFTFVGIYWNNHHHLMQAVHRVNGRILWANMHLLFWISLFPVTTHWMGDSHFAGPPVALYGIVLLLAAIAYYLLTKSLISHHGEDSTLARAIGAGAKEHLSLALYVSAIPLAFFSPPAACLLYVIVAVIWLIPDRRIEKKLEAS